MSDDGDDQGVDFHPGWAEAQRLALLELLRRLRPANDNGRTDEQRKADET